ncbi:MAG TPA: adenylate/guanylate cyclase domain-containing protein [Vineibacter sp.]|nr:adenylate/guanylate cyclase domain-containing protein [Vineibacter sp.]
MTREQRRLAAIISADVVGYSRLMGRDESGTLARLRAHRKLRFAPILARRGGRLVKLTGDGALAEFPSAVEALAAAIEFQQAMIEANRTESVDTAIVFRLGLHLGDLIVEEDDLYGDGVNVAARLEAESEPGGIVVSSTIKDLVTGRLKATFDDLGERALKNIERPVQSFRVRWNAADWPSSAQGSSADVAVAAIDQPPRPPDRPSIVVLPFQNMSGDPEQDYFADGMVEEITTALSRMRWLTVIARNSAFVYKGRTVDVRQVGRELGARYVLEGSVRKAAGQVRISGQLIDAASGAHLWADKFDGPLDDVFALHDRVAMEVAGAIEPAMRDAETQRARRKPTDSLDAYDLYMRGLSEIRDPSREGLNAAIDYARQATALDPHFAAALALHAGALQMFFISGWAGMEVQPEALRLSRAAIDTAGDDAEVLAQGANVFAYMLGDIEISLSAMNRALQLNPNSLLVLRHGGWVHLWAGYAETAIGHFAHALRLSPNEPWRGYSELGLAVGYLVVGRPDDALTWGRRAVVSLPNNFACHRIVAMALVGLGRVEEAREVVRQALQRLPQGRINVEHYLRMWRDQSQAESLIAAMRAAGVPD